MKCGGNRETKDHKPRSSSQDRDRPKKGFSSFVFFSAEESAEMEVNLIKHVKSINELEQAMQFDKPKTARQAADLGDLARR